MLRDAGATADSRVEGRGAAAAASGRDARRRFPAVGPHLAGLLLHGRHDPAQARSPTCCSGSRRLSRAIRAALRQRVPRRRRQPASADPVRRQRRRRDRAHRGVRRGDPRAVHRGRRHDHRRARRRRREARADVRAVRARRSSSASSASRRRSTRTACSIPARACRRCIAAPSSARCTCTTASCRIRTCRASRQRDDAMNAHTELRHARPDARDVADLVTRLCRGLRRARRRPRARCASSTATARALADAGAARRRRVPAHERGSRGDRAALPRGARAGDRVRRRHVARRPRRGALRRRVRRPVADEPRARRSTPRISIAACRPA